MRRHHGFWNDQRKHSLYLGFLLLMLALVVQINAGQYSSRRALDANPVGDLFLDNLPVLNLDYIIVQGALIMYIIGGYLFITRPRELLLGAKAFALFVIIRAFFMNLTYMGIYPRNLFDVSGPGAGFFSAITFDGNFFFSGHTGLPFLMALIFWREKHWRYFFVFVSVFFGMAALLAHVHYSIDVFAAPFITYTIFQIVAHLFPRDYALLAGSAPRGGILVDEIK